MYKLSAAELVIKSYFSLEAQNASFRTNQNKFDRFRSYNTEVIDDYCKKLKVSPGCKPYDQSHSYKKANIILLYSTKFSYERSYGLALNSVFEKLALADNFSQIEGSMHSSSARNKIISITTECYRNNFQFRNLIFDPQIVSGVPRRTLG